MSLNELKGKEVNEGIEPVGDGGFAMTGAGIEFYRLLTIRAALKTQIRGFRLSGKLPQGTTMARKYLGFRGNKESLLQQVEELIQRIQAERREA